MEAWLKSGLAEAGWARRRRGLGGARSTGAAEVLRQVSRLPELLPSFSASQSDL